MTPEQKIISERYVVKKSKEEVDEAKRLVCAYRNAKGRTALLSAKQKILDALGSKCKGDYPPTLVFDFLYPELPKGFSNNVLILSGKTLSRKNKSSELLCVNCLNVIQLDAPFLIRTLNDPFSPFPNAGTRVLCGDGCHDEVIDRAEDAMGIP